MRSDTPLDYAIFQLSPRKSRCELFVSSGGNTEKLASGLVKPFVSHLKVAEEQVTSASQSVKLEVGRRKNAETWFTKGTLERFVRFVSTPEVLEMVSTYDAEMSQLEAAGRIYSQAYASQGAGDQLSGGSTAAEDATKKELLRAIDIRLVAVRQELSTAVARADAAGFNVDTVPELQAFADRFGAHRLNEACSKFISLCERRSDLISPSWKSGTRDQAIRSSYGSDMSIDDDPAEPSPTAQTHQKQDDLPTSQQQHSFPLKRAFSRESSVERDEPSKQDNPAPESTPDLTSGSVATSQPSRRLSVQDRINMFESKQKESSGSKPVVTKSVELRRQTSDASTTSLGPAPALEKAVLKRWSGVSDMSIDLSIEKKDLDSPTFNNTSSPVPRSDERPKSEERLDDAVATISLKSEPKVVSGPGFVVIGEIGSKDASFNKSKDTFNSLENDDWKGQMLEKKTESKSFIISRPEDQEKSKEKFKSLPGGVFGFGGQRKLKGDEEIDGEQTQGDERPETRKQKEVLESSETQQRAKAPQKMVGRESMQFEATGAGSRIREAFAARYKGTEGETLPSETKKDFEENSEPVERMKFQRQVEKVKKAQVRRDESRSGAGNSRATDERDSYLTPPPPEQVQKVKGKQELNDELKMKANELEKLFAEHKISSARRTKLNDMQDDPPASFSSKKPLDDPPASFSFKKPVDDPPAGFSSKKPVEPVPSSQSSDDHLSTETSKFINATTTVTKVVGSSQSVEDALNKNFSGSRGKLYDSYMQKRNAKLREDWSFNREEKEARLKAMQDSLERNRTEMKAKFSASADRQDSISSTQRRAERRKFLSTRSIMKKEQQHLDFDDSDDDGNALQYLRSESRALDEPSSRNKKVLPSKTSSSFTPRTSVAQIPRSATKSSASGLNPSRRKAQPENLLAQSVPNFSELRKENSKPTKTTRPQARNYSRSKSTVEEAPITKDESRRSQSMRKSEFKDDGVVLTPLKFDEEVMKNVPTKPFLRKGSRASRVGIPKRAVEPANDQEEETEELVDFANVVKDEEKDDEFDTVNGEDDDKNLDDDNVERRLSVKSESENGDELPSFSQVDKVLGTDLPSSFNPVQDWTGESPMSWTSRTQNLFSSYTHDMSDVDSPLGSPASWNSHSLSQIDSDAARMRKKWGMAQKPMLVTNNSSSRKDMTRGFKRLLKFGRKSRGSENLADWISATTSEGDDDIMEDGRDLANRSSEDLRKSRMGFSHATASEESLMESEFYNEDNSSNSSILAPPASFKLPDDHFSGSSMKAPRSFFSLSTFRSKGSDSKPR